MIDHDFLDGRIVFHSFGTIPNRLCISTLSFSFMLSITILTSTRASLKPEINQTGWQCSPFSMMYVSYTSFCSHSSLFCFFLNQVVLQLNRMFALFLINDLFCWRKFKEKPCEKLAQEMSFEVKDTLFLCSAAGLKSSTADG